MHRTQFKPALTLAWSVLDNGPSSPTTPYLLYLLGSETNLLTQVLFSRIIDRALSYAYL